MANWRENYKHKIVSPEEALSHIESGDVIYSGSGNVTWLFDMLYDRKDELEGVELNLPIGTGPNRLFQPDAAKSFSLTAAFIGPVERAAIKNGRMVSYVPDHLSDLPYGQQKLKPAGAIIVMVSPPDEEGYCSFGISPIDPASIAAARMSIAQINENVPYVRGSMYKAEDFDYLIDQTGPVPVQGSKPPSEEEKRIAEHLMPYIENGSCIQLGIGGVANAVGSFLKDKKELGIHTEMFTEAMVDLIECGAVTNEHKSLDRGMTIFGFGAGSQRMYDLVNNNKDIESRSFLYVNNAHNISQIDNFVSINATMAVDIFGQCYSESIGFRQFSGTGGQVDFVRGASHSNGGKSFICLPSTLTKKDGTVQSKVILANEPGTIVTTPRTDVQYVATEYGVAYLENESIEERALRLIAIAHPDFREGLTEQARKVGVIS